MSDVQHPMSSSLPDGAAKAADPKSCGAPCGSPVTTAACEAQQRLTEAANQALQTVRKYPVETAVLAVGAGVLVWWLISRRHGSSA